jgi:integrase
MAQVTANSANSNPSSDDLTVREVIKLYQRNSANEKRHGPDALADRERTFKLFLAWPIEGKTIADLTVGECKAFHLRDFIDGHPTWKSASTRRAKANEIRAAFQWAFEEERINRNPFLRVRYAEAPPRPPLKDDVFDDLVVCANKRFERAVRFLRLTGCRLGELCGLTWAEVNFETRCVVIEKHKSRRYTNKPKVLPLVPAAVELLQSIRKRQPAEYTGAVFLNNRATPWTRRTLGQTFRRMKKRGEINTPASLHGLRHQFGTEAIKNGAPIKMVSLALGHSSCAVTERSYCHIEAGSEEVRQAAQAAAPKLPND